ncbi:MAG: GNAT family N-acetyltransferase [Acidobacteriales bacterium]|nr:GNAT family N-acetyltransferase [Terriglobales bacterium]
MPEGLTRIINPKDSAELLLLNTSIQTDRAFKVTVGKGGALTLVAEALVSPIEKRFPLTLDAEPWTQGWVIEQRGRIRGFIACAHNEWNKRFVIWHFYVDREHRRKGFGRQLMDCAISAGRQLGARTAWAETSNLNYPGVAAYQRLEFELPGFPINCTRRHRI